MEKKLLDCYKEALELIHKSKWFKAFNFAIAFVALVATVICVIAICWVTVAVVLGISGYTWNNLINPAIIIGLFDAVIPLMYLLICLILLVVISVSLYQKENKKEVKSEEESKPEENKEEAK